MYTFRKKGRNREMKTGRRIFALLLACMLCLMALPLTASAASGTGAERVLKKTQDSVAAVWVLGYDSDGMLRAVTGTCFAVGKAGKDTDVFVTNWHVVTRSGDFPVENARVWILKENCQIYSNGEPDPNNSIECRVLKTTSGFPDYAIIKMQKFEPGYKALPLMSAKKVEKGTQVYALGFPGIVDYNSAENYGGENLTATDGIVSRHSQMSAAGNTSVLLHTATISGGNSGGPLITKDGAVVGINTYAYGEVSADYSCAIYIDYAMEGLDELGIPYSVYSGSWVWIALIGAVIVLIGAVALVIVLRKKSTPDPKPNPDPNPNPNPGPKPHYLVQYKLVSDSGKIYPVAAQVTILGRDPSCQVCLPEGTKGVSRRHCQLTVQAGKLILTDIGSTYGTFIHETKIPVNTPVELHSGSYFCLGGPNSNRFTVQ